MKIPFECSKCGAYRQIDNIFGYCKKYKCQCLSFNKCREIKEIETK